MARILEHWRILVAVLFSLTLIASAFFLAYDIENPRSANASAESDLLMAIATKDTDGDGLPDWEESLYGADPEIIDTFNLGMSDGQAVARGLVVPRAVAEYEVPTSSSSAKTPWLDDSAPPPPAEGTLTAAFAQNVYSAYRMAYETKGGDLSGEEIKAVVDEALRAFSSSIKISSNFKTAQDITISSSGPEALRSYAGSVEAILNKSTEATSKSELAYLQEVVQDNLNASLAPMLSIAKAYRESAIGIAKISVPVELSVGALNLMNALMRLSELTTNFAQVHVDPLATMLALEQYPQAVLSLAQSLIDIGAVYRENNIVFENGESGAGFVNIISDMVAEQSDKKK